jgi:hypothetical protein
VQRSIRELLFCCLGHAEVDYLRHRAIVLDLDQQVRRLDVAVDDALLVRVLHAFADLAEQLESLVRRQPVAVTVVGDRLAPHQLHREEGAAIAHRAGIEHPCDVRVVHHGQRLALGLESRQHLLGVHARLDQLQGDAAPDRLGLLGLPDLPHAALADQLDQAVGVAPAAAREATNRRRLVVAGVDPGRSRGPLVAHTSP